MPAFLLTLKKYWKVIALVVGAVVGVVLLRQREISFTDDYRKIQEAHDAELKKVQDARDEERKKLDENQKKLDAALVEVQKKYDEQEITLDAKKKTEIENIVKEHGDDPDALAKKLAEATGFVVILPKD